MKASKGLWRLILIWERNEKQPRVQLITRSDIESEYNDADEYETDDEVHLKKIHLPIHHNLEGLFSLTTNQF